MSGRRGPQRRNMSQKQFQLDPSTLQDADKTDVNNPRQPLMVNSPSHAAAADGGNDGMTSVQPDMGPSLPSGISIESAKMWEPRTSHGEVLGVVVYDANPSEQLFGTCRVCNQPETDKQDPLFTPCDCPGAIHRSCFRKQRSGLLLTALSNFWSCPECLFSYRMERLVDVPMDTEREIRQRIKMKLALLWLSIIGVIGSLITILALIAWASDKSHKNVPVGMKAAMASVIFGWPNANKTREWQAEFKGDARTFQYYGLLASLIVSIIILILACLAPQEIFGDADQVVSRKEGRGGRRKRGCCEECCHDTNTGGSSSWYFCYFGYGGGNTNCCDCSCCCDGCTCFDGGAKDCKAPDGGCSGAGEATVIIVVVVVIIIIVSAIFVIIFFGVRRSMQLSESVSVIIRQQQEELENCTIVFGKDEQSAPSNRV